MTYDDWEHFLAAELGAVCVLGRSAHGWRKLCNRLADQLVGDHMADAAAVLRTVAQSDVAAAALEREQVQLARRRAMVRGPWPPQHRGTRERYVYEGLAHRDNVAALGDLVTEALAPVVADPPGGRSCWPGFWPADRGRDRQRGRRT